jgi:hypothetical protein
VEASEIGPSGGLKDGLLQAFPSIVVSQNCEDQTSGLSHAVFRCGERMSVAIAQGTTPLGLAQLEFANIEMYLCESLHRSLMLDWC